MDALDDDYRVVDDDGDGQYQGAERKQVKAEPDKVEHAERTDQGHGDGDGGNQRRAEILQEDVNDDEHEDERLDERLDYFVDRGEEEVVGVLRDVHLEAGRHGLLGVGEEHLEVLDNLRGV